MNFRSITIIGKIIALVAIVSLASCKKDDLPSLSSNSKESDAANLSDSSSVADNMYYDVLNNAFIGFSDNSSVWTSGNKHEGKTTTFSTEAVNGTTGLSCAMYSISDSTPDEYPKTLTVDFGSGCSSADGILRKGKIIYVFSGPLLFPGTTASVTFDQYSVLGYGIQGVYTITNNSSVANGISLTTQVTNGIITFPNLTNYHYGHNKTYALTEGSATPFNITDDVYAISGNSSFSVAGGSSIVFTVSTPLVKAISCHNIKAGVVGFVYNGSVNGSIDFGDGTCDDLATATVGTFTKTIILR